MNEELPEIILLMNNYGWTKEFIFFFFKKKYEKCEKLGSNAD